MQYINTSPTNFNGQGQQPPSAQVSDWHQQSNHNQAEQAAGRQLPGSQAVDVQDDGDEYRVHVRERDGSFRTVFMDRGFNTTRTQAGILLPLPPYLLCQ